MSRAKLKAKLDREAERPVHEAVDPDEPSELEVQRMLEAEDRGELPEPVAEGPAIEPVSPPDGPHALENAPVNSKIVVVLGNEGKTIAFLATPDGVHALPPGDPAHSLPDGARIQKRAEGLFRAEQLSPAVDHEPKDFVTVRDAIVGFVAHFHGPI